MDKNSISGPVFDEVPTAEVEDRGEMVEGHLNMSGDSALSAMSSTSGVSSNFEPPADIVSLCSFYFKVKKVLT